MRLGADERLSRLLAECADLIQAGSTVSACLARFPESADELEPLLTTMVELQRLKPVPPRAAEIVEKRRAHFVLAAQHLATTFTQSAGARSATRSHPTASWWEQLGAWLLGSGPQRGRLMPVGVLAILTVILISGLFATSVASAAERALPGDLLYPVKTTVEGFRLSLLRDPAQRAAYRERLNELRRVEALTVADTGRRVRSLGLEGTLEAIEGSRWTVSGLTVLIARDTRIIGTPVLGAKVSGTMRAPGDYTLVGVYLEVEPPTGPAGARPSGQRAGSTPAGTPRPTATRAPPTASPTPTDTPGLRGSGPIVDAVYAEPTDRPPARLTRTLTPRPTITRTPTLTKVPSTTPTKYPTPPREVVKARIIGWVERIEGDLWTIDGVTIQCNANTEYIGNPGVGSQVEAIVEVRPDGALICLSIRRIDQPEPNPTPEPVEITDVVNAIDGEWWTIGGTRVRVNGQTQLVNDPGLGDMVELKAEKRAGGDIVALRITKLQITDVYFEGVIESMGGDGWVISGTRVIVSGSTDIRGTPEIGATVQVAALEYPDGRIVATIIAVVAPPQATATLTPVATPTATVTPAPTLTPTPEMISKATATP